MPLLLANSEDRFLTSRHKYLKAKILKALNLLKVISHNFWGADVNHTSQALSISSPVKVRLWLYYKWLCMKIVSSNV